MKKKLILTSTLIVLMLVLLPTTTAFQNTTQTYQTKPLPTLEEIQQMDINTIIDYLLQLADQHTELQTRLTHYNNDDLTQDLEDITNNNQTLLQRMFNFFLNLAIKISPFL